MSRQLKTAVMFVLYLFLAVPQVFASVVINEVFPNPSGDSNEAGEWIELYNSGPDPIDLGGWKLSDDGVTTYTIASGSSISVGGFLTFEKSVTNIALNNSGDIVRLYDTPDHVADAQSYSSISEDKSVGRSSDGGGSWVLCNSSTKATSNNCPLPTVTPVPTTIISTATPQPTLTPGLTNTPILTPIKTITPTIKPKATPTQVIVPTIPEAEVLAASDEGSTPSDESEDKEALNSTQARDIKPLTIIFLFIGAGFGLLTIAALWHNKAIWQKLRPPQQP